MKVHILGSGTSTGVPTIRCECPVCSSDNPKNKRLRASILVESENCKILVDTGPDLRTQMLRLGVTKLDAVLYTHSHADHVFGIDDLRPFCFGRPEPLSLYADNNTSSEIERNFKYCFYTDPDYEGGATPQLAMNSVEPLSTFTLSELPVTPIPIMHGKQEILGYKIGKMAYLTDCSQIPPKSQEELQDLELLILTGLRNRPHPTHFTIEEAVEQIEMLKPKSALLTHISHEVEHEGQNKVLRGMSDISIELAYDQMVVEIR